MRSAPAISASSAAATPVPRSLWGWTLRMKLSRSLILRPNHSIWSAKMLGVAISTVEGRLKIILRCGRRLPGVHHRLADLDGVGQLGAGEALGRILQHDLGLRHRRHQLLDQLHGVDGDGGDAGLVEAEDDAALQRRGRVVDMHDGAAAAADGLEGAADEVLARLGQHLDGDVIGDELLVDDRAHEIEIGLRGRGEADLDLLEAQLDQQVEHAALALGPHGIDERLVAVAQVDAAPDGRAVDDARRASGGRAGRWAERRGICGWACRSWSLSCGARGGGTR